MRVAVVGTGYVGLVTGTCFAEVGNEVICVDINEEKVKKLKSGQVPIYEPGLEELFERNIHENRLHFTTDLSEGIEGAAVIFLALPTPPGADGSADLSFILKVADDLGGKLKEYAVIVDKSTVPVGTAEQVKEHIATNAKVEFDVVSNPEFLREGFAVSDFMNPDRIVIGTSSERASAIMHELYDSFSRQGSPILDMDERSAEMTKYAANSFLATKISFMNEIANLCERVGADVDAVRLGIGSDERIGKRFLFPGIGYGGSCFPKDVQALRRTAKTNGYDFKILEAVETVNARQKQVILEKVLNYYEQDVSGKTFALWGLAFKPDTDDIREAPALDIIEGLLSRGAQIKAFDPEATENVQRHFGDKPGLSFVAEKYEALDESAALIIATEWPEFGALDLDKLLGMLSAPVIFDGRNMYELQMMHEHGVHYESIGRNIITQ